MYASTLFWKIVILEYSYIWSYAYYDDYAYYFQIERKEMDNDSIHYAYFTKDDSMEDFTTSYYRNVITFPYVLNEDNSIVDIWIIDIVVVCIP